MILTLLCFLHQKWSFHTHELNWLTKQKQAHRFKEWTYGCQREGQEKGIVGEFGMDMQTLLYLKWVTNKDLLYREHTVFPHVASLDRRGVWQGMDYMHLHGWVPLLLTWSYHTIVHWLHPNTNIKGFKNDHFRVDWGSYPILPNYQRLLSRDK